MPTLVPSLMVPPPPETTLLPVQDAVTVQVFPLAVPHAPLVEFTMVAAEQPVQPLLMVKFVVEAFLAMVRLPAIDDVATPPEANASMVLVALNVVLAVNVDEALSIMPPVLNVWSAVQVKA